MLLQNKRPNLGANLKQKIEDRKEAFALDRKTKKDLRDIGRRNIDVNMSPYITPASKNVKLPVIKPSLNNDTVNKRLEMLAKWKADKAKAKEQSTRSKPIFKVSTVVSDPSTKLENANRFIKGKLIVSTTQKSKFAPDNYKFKAPSTVKNLVTTLGDKTGSKSGTVPKKSASDDNGNFSAFSVSNHAAKVEPSIVAGTKSKGVRKSNGNAISARKEPKKTLDAIGNLSNDQKINPPVYISPFVTISRGKKNARDEHIIRRSLGRDLSMKNTDIDVASIINGHTSPDAAADYFMAKLNASIQNINELCEKWGKCLQDPALSEEASSSIVGTIGQSKLLISDKFEQFRKLIIQCKNQDSAEGYIRCEDLHGFWDMIYLQVEKLEKTFDHLHCLKENNWIELLPEKKVVKKCPKVRGTKPVAQSRIKDLIKAAREKRNKMENNVVEECKRVEVKTPKREPQVPQAEPQSSSKRRSSRVSLLAENSRHSSPGLIVMKLMQSIKYGDGLTPARSILKHQNLKSTGKKSVTFRPSLTTGTLTPTALFRAEEKENTPRMVRRSRRTSQAIS
ncbi:hypothetical protein D910_07030 [Dendroctonus ponderosae]|uniref:Guanylate kinase-associated protein mars n=1 Tax=Dendroctonus ponderosae TaxID=77166 RepID=U4U9C9_DENPD|nr:hypothetical protein D910_07030 [Dendroctonus ponderosae]